MVYCEELVGDQQWQLIQTLGGDTAEGYISAQAVIAYANKHIDRYSSVTTANVTQAIEPAIRRATAYVDGLGKDKGNNKSPYWSGRRKTGTQALEWPRTGATFNDGAPIADTIIPLQIINSVCEVTCWEIANPDEQLHTILTLSEVTKGVKIGPISETTMGAQTLDDARAMLTLVSDYLANVLRKPNDGSNFRFITNDGSN